MLSARQGIFVGITICIHLFWAGPAFPAEPPQFADVTSSSGTTHTHQTTQTILSRSAFQSSALDAMDEVAFMKSKSEIMSTWLTGGVAAGDYDGDGLPDLFVVGGDAGTARLFRNLGNGTFEDKASAAGVAVSGERQIGAMFVDIDGDRDLDLFVGGMVGIPPRLFRNNGPNGFGETTFTDIFSTAFPDYDLARVPNNLGGSFGDYDLDGDLDVFFAHSMTPFGPRIDTLGGSTYHLFRNDSTGAGVVFTDVSVPAGIAAIFALPAPGDSKRIDHTFAPNFVDLNEDGAPDLLVVSDSGDSLILLNNGDGTFLDATVRQLFLGPGSREVAGMGAAVGDFNNDGHFDWFISQIHDNLDGNRLYHNDGLGTFTDVGDVGIENGYWGWGACTADLDNDRHLDIFHVNGFYWDGNPFSQDDLFSDMPAVAFMANGDGSYTEKGADIGLADIGEGRGVSCFDFDRDGDIDVAVSNHRGPFRLYQNNLDTQTSFLGVRLRGRAPNTQGIGARLEVRSNDPLEKDPAQLIRQIAIEGNFVSSNLAEAHFGLGDWQGPFELEILWPRGRRSKHTNVMRNTFVTAEEILLAPPTELTFEEDEPAILSTTATGPEDDDRSAAIEWFQGSSAGNPVATGSTFDASGLAAGNHDFLVGVRDAGGTLTSEPFTLVVQPATPPLRSSALTTHKNRPGNLTVTLSLQTDEAATCRWSSLLGTSFAAMSESFDLSGGTSHQTSVSGLALDVNHEFHIRCSDSLSHANADDLTLNVLVPLEIFADEFESGDFLTWQ